MIIYDQDYDSNMAIHHSFINEYILSHAFFVLPANLFENFEHKKIS